MTATSVPVAPSKVQFCPVSCFCASCASTCQRGQRWEVAGKFRDDKVSELTQHPAHPYAWSAICTAPTSLPPSRTTSKCLPRGKCNSSQDYRSAQWKLVAQFDPKNSPSKAPGLTAQFPTAERFRSGQPGIQQ